MAANDIRQPEENEQGFPIQLKILIAVIVMGVLTLAFRVFGIF